ncbi:MAG: class I SAM-dependent methyltransferase [Smithella sp.]|jgi:predicted O-methyltransferase YrrM
MAKIFHRDFFMEINKENINKVKGFLDEREADCLYKLALKAGKNGPCLEIGSYCGKSSVYIGTACKKNATVLFSIDHHTGSEEQQPGEAYFDPDLFDKETGKVDTLKHFRKTIADFDLEDVVIPVIGRSALIGSVWKTPLSLIFIDGSHAYESVLNDYNIWANNLIPGGYLLFHDIFPDPAKGGQAPYLVYQKAVESGLYEEMPMFESLGILIRK